MILAGDIGGTRARLALYEGGVKGKPLKHDTFESRAYPSLEAVVRAFLGPKLVKKVSSASFGIAGPVVNGVSRTTNLAWVLDERRLSQELDIPAVRLVNDMTAIGAMEVAREHGLRVPEDLSIVGFDDTFEALIVTPSLTTVRQPLAEMGRMAVALLVRLLQHQRIEALHIELETQLVLRDSTAPPARVS